MPYLTTDDGVKLYYEETGSGRPTKIVQPDSNRICRPAKSQPFIGMLQSLSSSLSVVA